MKEKSFKVISHAEVKVFRVCCSIKKVYRVEEILMSDKDLPSLRLVNRC